MDDHAPFGGRKSSSHGPREQGRHAHEFFTTGLGLEVVNARGEIWNGLFGLRKDNTGYDLRHLFIGSEGSLGIVTAATLKLYPRPRTTLTAWATLPSLQAAVRLLGLARRTLGTQLSGFEFREALGMMRAIKRALDPAGLFNPGRVLAA